ncbi:MAG: DNA polymerase I [Candidatus Kerfeldbacteria bacterium CG08_land_8_20_14_0_20_40_16]|uniref:DNA polymerase I n=1 Tax=Candidatus Kerfeldbacteria bacterium CG08_land_8_20_14_0_20_40_16 TaxID=2014244 RepID=A0A2H0YX81_9BACT|nr:MAG: DNA polymerase I [Candidatus Kerfeldbacteria bacterium CG08_land_8_20_14_0_20_40_16]
MVVKQRKFVIIDGNALIHRAFHALPPLSTKEGKLVNAVYGFTTIFLRVLKELKPEYVAVTFDRKAPTFRHEEYKDYKATRVKQPDELYEQIPIIKDLVEAFRVPIFEKDGFEADDLIGTISHQKELRDLKTIIVTGDLDTLQLVDDNTEIYTLKRGIADTIVYDEKSVKEKYDGLGPEQMIDLKALKGDASDNIPGVKGIGEKGAVSLLKTFGTLDKIYQSLNKKDKLSKKISERNKKLLLEHKKDALLSKRLATIVNDVPIKFDLEKCKSGKYDRQKVVEILQSLEFKSLLNKLPEDSTQEKIDLFQPSAKDKKNKTGKEHHDYQLIDDPKKFSQFIAKLKKEPAFALDTETNSLDPIVAELIGISFAWEKGKAYFVLAQGSFLKELRPILEDEKIAKYGHNIKYDLAVLRKKGINLQGIAFDTMIASYLLNPGSRQHNLDNVVFSELGHEMIPIEALIGEKGKKQKSMNQVPIEKVSYYSCEDADYTNRLVKPLTKQLEEKVNLGLLEKIEIPLIPVLAEMEINGVKIDPQFLNSKSQDFAKEIQGIEKKIYKLAGEKFNINSPLQLKEILFEKLKIPTDDIKKIKTGFSTAAGELEKMRGKHQIIDLVSEYREYTKLKSTYLDALPKLISPQTGRVHTSFNQTITATGRLSSSDPNLQNIPIRTAVGREIRKAFVAEKSYELLSIDYSQIELRIVASLASDQKMISIFEAGEDIHKSTAAEINEVPLDKVTKEMRYAAKEVNFGVLYGMGVYGLAWRTQIERGKAKEFIDKYFSAFKGVKEYIDQTKALAQSMGYVETLFGRRRYLPEINSGVAQIRNAAERMAINMPIQGTAADLIKLAMISVQKELAQLKGNEEGRVAKMILQVHDELVFEVQSDKIKLLARKIKEIMETVYKLKVPIEAEAKTGKNWGELKPVKFND